MYLTKLVIIEKEKKLNKILYIFSLLLIISLLHFPFVNEYLLFNLYDKNYDTFYGALVRMNMQAAFDMILRKSFPTFR